ncbi:SDR family oxidoreductase [Blastococcus sp. CT_GayMR19]|uniref:SDR family NAD(P)-dependent oxidoreductase n=1 Tax=Blastococcus sp. CT_GayMR19 TaxID=2559608 RepID=UPI0010742A71|nr:SDR family NAD(P)-dependent oxidoreductase [Blastococcus sp. CT_GayMR19]TFV71042.1 SDR family oxidoreductase [Blastococcus sp. CT_GayMR19]
MPAGPLDGHIALVTGASTGIGRRLAHALAARGAAVAGLARGAERLDAAMAEIGDATGSPAIAVAADVADPAAVDAAVARVVDELGPVDLLVNNAGLIDAAEVPVWAADRDQWWAVVESHIRGPQLLISAVVPAMVERGRGRVVDLASGMGTRAVPEYSAYSVGKAGQIRLTEALAASLAGTGVYAFNIAPGLVQTEMTGAMPKWRDHTEWTAPEHVVDLVCAAAEGRLDGWSGRFLRAGVDFAGALPELPVDSAARQLRLRSWGPDDPVA